jgi:sporulation protein YlmC with PRC-barrel domain
VGNVNNDPLLDDEFFKYGAISIDNNILKGLNYKFNNGVLSKLKQFKNSNIKVIQTDIVDMESRKHILELFKADHEKIKSSIDKLRERVEIPFDDIEKVEDLLLLKIEPNKKTADKLDSFYNDIGAQVIVSGDYVDLNSIVNMYFSCEAPFEENGKKKYEFPDAIALMSLENWAIKNDTKVLAVSEDKGWVDFADGSERIDIINNLTEALSLLQPQQQLHELISKVRSSKVLDEEEIINHVRNDVYDSNIDIDYYSHMSSSIGGIDVELEDYILPYDNNDDLIFTIIDINDDCMNIVVSVEVIVKYIITIDFNVVDSIDGDYIAIDSSTYVKTMKYMYDVLIDVNYFGGVNDAPISNLYMEVVEVTNNQGNFISIGEVCPSFMEEEPY